MELVLQEINKHFKDKYAVKNVSLTLSEGVHALLGANGSGKTTLLRIICGLQPSEGGSIHFDEMDAMEQYDTYASLLGYVPQHFGFYPHYTLRGFLEYMAIIKRLKPEYSKQRIDYVVKRLHLEDVQKKKMKTLSGGMLRRVGIAQALLNEPKILVLDEPTAGLDPKERIVLRNLIAALADCCIIILSTHIVSDIESIADDIMVMKNGEIVLNDTCEELLDVMEGKVWEVVTDKITAHRLMNKFIIVKSHQMENGYYLRIVSDAQPYISATRVVPDLDDLYLYYFQVEGEIL